MSGRQGGGRGARRAGRLVAGEVAAVQGEAAMADPATHGREPVAAGDGAGGPSALAMALCRDCGQPFDLSTVEASTALCASCFAAYLHGLETPFLENYARFGAKAHRTVAEALLRALALADPDDRKVMGMRVVEEYLNAAAELIGLYLALRRRQEAPVLDTFLGFELNVRSMTDFRVLTHGRSDDEIMRELGLPTLRDVEGARGEVKRRDYKQMRTAVESVVTGLERLTRVEQRALLQIASGLQRSKTLTHKLDWLPDRRMQPDQVALLVLEQKRRVLAAYPLAIQERQLQSFVDAIDRITCATRDMIWLYLHVREVAGAGASQS